MINRHHKILLYLILVLAGIFRLYGINWDQGFHLHPDERAIVLSVIELRLPENIGQFLSPDSPLNPKFFAYGSFPFYLLFIAGNIAGIIFHPIFAAYDGINIVGRLLSALFDLGTILVLYQLGKRFFNLKIGLLAGFFYAISVLPIQLSHFYAVDTPLTFFILLSLYFLLIFIEKRSYLTLLLLAISFGLAVASKISAILLIFPILIAFGYLFVSHKKETNTAHRFSLIRLVLSACMLLAALEITIFLAEPYAVIDAKQFLSDALAQSEMTKDAFTFPYTLQYVGKIPYLYELYNFYFFGQGILLASLSLLGTGFVVLKVLINRKKEYMSLIILLGFFIPYILIVGNFKVGFMRYLLPVYPLFALFAAYSFTSLINYSSKKISKHLLFLLLALFYIALLIWPLSFMHIYAKPNTRVLATEWIHAFIPKGSTIAIEHWDDSLPLFGQEQYDTITLPLYDPDTDEKWNKISEDLKRTDYIIIASNRLYTPLLKLTDCQKLPAGRCYGKTAEYYTELFSEQLGFKKVAEFTNYPTLPILNLPFNDQHADESFTVYDHPKVMIYKRQ